VSTKFAFAAEHTALHRNKIVQQALGFSGQLYGGDAALPLSKVCNLTTDTASTVQSAAKLLQQNYRLIKGMLWTLCSCHVLNLYLLNQNKSVCGVREVVKSGRQVVHLFANSQSGCHRLFAR
jgi:hypothetical protein